MVVTVGWALGPLGGPSVGKEWVRVAIDFWSYVHALGFWACIDLWWLLVRVPSK